MRFRDKDVILHNAQIALFCILCPILSEKEGENKEVSSRESEVLAGNSCARNSLATYC